MIDGINVQCNYCKTKTRLRFQLGFFDIPFDFCCPECGVHIHGIRRIVDKQTFKINNATTIENGMDDFDYYIDLSVELPQRKITKYESLEKLVEGGFSPFMMTSQIYGLELYQELVKGIGRFVDFRETRWHQLMPLYDLYFNKKIELTRKPLLKLSQYYTVKNELDVAMALHQQTVLGVNNLLADGTLKQFSLYGNKVLREMNPLLVDTLIERLGRKKWFKSVLKRVNNIYCRWIEDFEKYIPAVMLVRGDRKDALDKDLFGIATIGFEEMIDFYAKSYELVLEMLDIAVGLNNTYVRGTYDKFHPDSKIKDWTEYCKKTKSERLGALIDGEPFSRAIKMDRHVRNAIAHFNYEFDAGSQRIIFTDLHRSKESTIDMYLVDLAQLCYENVVLLIYLNELMYSLRKYDYRKDGLIPNIKFA